MRVKRIKSDFFILHKNTELKLKICGACQEIQFTAGTNKKCRFKISVRTNIWIRRLAKSRKEYIRRADTNRRRASEKTLIS